ncbi:MAG TPA: phosphonate metabolism protein/1,5-bisphosphokinase (PRPP-forming) PhnN [Nordella sp.]|nr:phosphonate metabolism protein/1,5-bisphosphokinase (PRPP-forming) PhnN [Nordella sp.]
MRNTGRLVLVVGPSGAGKDSLLREAMLRLASDRHIVFPRRIITRPSHDETEAHDSLIVEEFLAAQAQGHFALSWQAHGLHYGIPISLLDELNSGRTAAVNVSRAIIAVAAERFPTLAVLNVTAPAEIIAERLSRRGREAPADIAARIARDAPRFDDRVETVTIVNDTTLEAAARAFTAALLEFSKESNANAL